MQIEHNLQEAFMSPDKHRYWISKEFGFNPHCFGVQDEWYELQLRLRGSLPDDKESIRNGE